MAIYNVKYESEGRTAYLYMHAADAKKMTAKAMRDATKNCAMRARKRLLLKGVKTPTIIEIRCVG